MISPSLLSFACVLLATTSSALPTVPRATSPLPTPTASSSAIPWTPLAPAYFIPGSSPSSDAPSTLSARALEKRNFVLQVGKGKGRNAELVTITQSALPSWATATDSGGVIPGLLSDASGLLCGFVGDLPGCSPTPTAEPTLEPTAEPTASSTDSTPTPEPTPATPGLTNGLTYWSLKSTFGSTASFMQSMDFTRWIWGLPNSKVVQGVPRSAWAAGAREYNNGSVLEVAYPEGSINPGNTPQGGMGFYSSPISLTTATNVSMAYSVFFPVGFNFVKAGKLPGLYGGRTGCSGGSAAENCFSSRLMWRTGGKGEMYLYAPRAKQVEALCTILPISYCNNVYGIVIGRGSWTFKTGEWTDIRQDVWMNTPGVADGGFNIWINNKLVLTSSSVYYRNAVLSGGNVNGTAPPPMNLIDYDAIPDDVAIPNGGFKQYPPVVSTSTISLPTGGFSTSLVSKIIITPTPTTTRRGIMSYENAEARKRSEAVEPTPIFRAARKVVDLIPTKREDVLAKRAVTTVLPIGFKGMMIDTFFGGSSEDYATPVTTRVWFNQFALRIRA